MSDDTSPRTDAAALSARLRELETTCILASESESDDAQARAWHERAECAYRAADTIDRLTRERDTLRRALAEAFDTGATAASSQETDWDFVTSERAIYLAAQREPEAARAEPT